jgi:hypothetical protein
MNLSSKLDHAFNVGIATIIAILMTYYTGLCEPWLEIACGMAAAFSLRRFSVHAVVLIFILISSLSMLESSPWYLGRSSLIFGLSGLTATLLLQITQKSSNQGIVCRLVQVIPILLVVYLMPVPAAFFATSTPKRAILDAGVWGTIAKLPKGEDALVTRHQYTYEKFQQTLGADIISLDHSLELFDELYIITPTRPFEAKDIQAICDWTKNGGRLVVIADHTNLFGHQTVLQELLKKFGIAIRPDAIFETKTNGGIYSNLLEEFAGLTPCSIAEGVIPRLKMTGWSENPDYTATSFFGEMSPSNDDRYGRYPILGAKRYGVGEVSVFTDSTFFANFTINRWSSQTLLSSLLWSGLSAIAAAFGFVCTLIYICNSRRWLLTVGYLFVLISPSLGFRIDKKVPSPSVVGLAPPDTVDNATEERDKGIASSLLASAYAYNVEIDWSKNAPTTLKEHLQNRGIKFSEKINEGVDWLKCPSFDLHEILTGRFYVDENSFWFNQGVGPIRALNMTNFWRSLGAKLDSSVSNPVIVESKVETIEGPDKKSVPVQIDRLTENWAIIDNRIIAKWIPESSKWLVRKEWQLGSWIKKDFILKPID